MARVNWQTAQAELDSQENNSTGVGFFTLKNDGDYAVVRIMHDSPEDFDICAVHSIGEGKSFRNVSCLRDPSEPIQNCPLCAAGKKVALRMYIHLIEYTKDEQTGAIKAQAKVWDRHTSYARTLIQYMNDYGPLSDVLFKIVRHGKAGSTDTRYDIIYANPRVYAPEFYPKDPALFANYSAEGTAVVRKTYEEMVAIANGGPVDTKSTPTTEGPAHPGTSYSVPPSDTHYTKVPSSSSVSVRTESVSPRTYGDAFGTTRPYSSDVPAPHTAQQPVQQETGRPRRFY